MDNNFKPTEEQVAIIEASLTGGSMVVEAGAGAAKTTSLELIARAKPKIESGVYVAYNRAIAGDAKAKFPRNTQCATAHSFAFRAVGVKFKHRLNGPRVTAKQTAAFLGVNGGVSFGEEANFGPVKLALLAMGTVTRFCYSDDPHITSRHVPFIPGTEKFFNELAEIVTPYALKAWDDLIREDGRLRFQHDVYLKLWALSNPTLPGDFVLLDEAQDANPVIEGVVKRQDAQIIMVGDTAQQIYAWRGAQDAMSRFHADHRLDAQPELPLRPGCSRRGEQVAGTPQRSAPAQGLRQDQVGDRNAGCAEGDPVSHERDRLWRKLSMLRKMTRRLPLSAARRRSRCSLRRHRDLQSGQTYHASRPRRVQDVGRRAGVRAGRGWQSDLKVFVKLIDEYGVQTVMNVADKAVDEKYADIIVSTAHKSKGREWSSVKICRRLPRAGQRGRDAERSRSRPSATWPTCQSPEPRTSSTAAGWHGSTTSLTSARRRSPSRAASADRSRASGSRSRRRSWHEHGSTSSPRFHPDRLE